MRDPFSFVNAYISCGASRLAKSAATTCVWMPCFFRRPSAISCKRSSRRAVSTRCVPPAASSSARATPIPALAPVTSAHLPFHSLIIRSCPWKIRSSRRIGWIRFARTQNRILQTRALLFHPVHQSPSPYKLRCQQRQSQKNHQPAGTRRNQHNRSQPQERKPSENFKEAPDLLDGLKEHMPSKAEAGNPYCDRNSCSKQQSHNLDA